MTQSFSEQVRNRLEALNEYHILDTDPEPEFDQLTQLASDICDTPMSSITLLDDHRQWFKSKIGLTATETPIEHSFCAHVADQRSVLVVPDALRDQRFAHNPSVVADPHIRFYAGAPLINRQGVTLGALCAIDRVPRELDPHQLQCLGALANKVVELLEGRKNGSFAEPFRQKTFEPSHYQGDEQLNRALRLIEGVAKIIESTQDRDALVVEVLDAICVRAGWSIGHAWIPSADLATGETLEHYWHWDDSSVLSHYQNAMEAGWAGKSSCLLRRSMELGEIVFQSSLGQDIHSGHSQLLHRLGFRSAVAVPVRGTATLGAMEFYLNEEGAPDEAFTEVLECAGQLLGQALEREASGHKNRCSEPQSSFLTEETQDMVTILDKNGLIRFENSSSLYDLGWTAADLVGRNAFEFLHPEDAPDMLGAFQESLRCQADTSLLSFRFRHKNGSYRMLEGTGSNHLADPAVAGIVFKSRDVTEKKRLESRFGELADGIAHDLNHLQTAVVGYSSAAEENSVIDPKLHDALLEIQMAAERAASLTSQLLAPSGTRILQPRALLLDEQLAEGRNSLAPLLGHSVFLELNFKAPGARIHIDPIQLDTVLFNLALNAREAMNGVGVISLSSHVMSIVPGVISPAGLPPGCYGVIVMSDHGCGMSEEMTSHLFDPIAARFRGKGFGLATCQGIIRQSRGRIIATSEPNHGSTFSIYLPLVEMPKLEDAPPLITPKKLQKTRTILFAEDEQSIRDLGIFVMEESGYRVLCVGGGHEALALLDAHPGLQIDLLLTDILMPGMGGKALAVEVRQRHPEMPIIFCSGYGMDATFSEGLTSQTYLLPKPYTPASMLAKLDECFKADG